jgi:Leucine-rich repeat (LRR) protein
VEQKMREEIIQKIDASPLNEVDLGDMAIKDSELQEILDLFILIRPRLQTLFLNNNEISDIVAIVIKKGLEKLPSIGFIDLQFNHLDKEGAIALLALKVKNPELQIALHGNKIADVRIMQEIENAAKGSSDE